MNRLKNQIKIPENFYYILPRGGFFSQRLFFFSICYNTKITPEFSNSLLPLTYCLSKKDGICFFPIKTTKRLQRQNAAINTTKQTPIQRIADRAASFPVPVTLLTAILAYMFTGNECPHYPSAAIRKQTLEGVAMETWEAIFSAAKHRSIMSQD
nr:hypothetical protein [uncultured Acetatifactor sp.]